MGGPDSGQRSSQPDSLEMPSWFGPRHCGQSSPQAAAGPTTRHPAMSAQAPREIRSGTRDFRACLKSERGPATMDFVRGRGGETGTSPQRAVTVEATKATCKRPVARRVWVEKAALLRCSSVTDPWRVCSFVAPCHPAFSTQTGLLSLLRQALRRPAKIRRALSLYDSNSTRAAYPGWFPCWKRNSFHLHPHRPGRPIRWAAACPHRTQPRRIHCPAEGLMLSEPSCPSPPPPSPTGPCSPGLSSGSCCVSAPV